MLEDLTKKYGDKVSIALQSAELLEEHTDPLLVVFDKKGKEVVSMTFNFIDVMGGKPNLSAESK